MSGIDALVIAFGLFLGYWVVAKLFADKPADPPSSPTGGDSRRGR